MLVAIATALLVAEVVHEDLVDYPGEQWVAVGVTVLFAAALAIAILRYRLYELDLAVSRALVYGALTLVLGAAYAGIVTAAGALTSDRLAGTVPAAVAVAVLFAPLRTRLQRTTRRLLFGDRDDPYAVIASVGRRLGDGADSGGEGVLPALASTIAQTLKLAHVAIDTDGTRVAEVGRPAGESRTVPLVYAGSELGQLIAGARHAARFSSAEVDLLHDIARQVAVAAHAVALSADLEHSRRELVTAREEERRRVRRDLHDGLGPSLAAISLQIASARMLLARDPDAAGALLDSLVGETQTAIAEIRRLVYALRPPALDELGLVPALRMQAERFPGLAIRVVADAPGDALPAAVELAAYRIATEALTNVARHAAATRCTIALRLGGNLELEIVDDGGGLAAGWRAGIGVSSIRERAAELGGSCLIDNRAHGGARVLARLPLPAEA